MHRSLKKYLAARAVVRPLIGLDGRLPAGVDRAVVVPAREEFGALPATLESLARAPLEVLRRTLAVVVVNNSPPPDPVRVAADRVAQWRAGVADNRQTLEWLGNHREAFGFTLAWVDAVSPGRELSPAFGVGLARKIGCDSVLHWLYCGAADREVAPPERFVILNLDADAPVNRDYLVAAVKELSASGLPGGVTRFRHRTAPTPAHQYAIDCYELYLRYYVAGLVWARSPYAFHTVGSTIVCSAAGYAAAGGFSRKRRAGEDFYLVQQLVKVGGVCRVHGAEVFPSPRVSERVPFGTGPAVREILVHSDRPYLVYAPEVFPVVKSLLEAIRGAVSPAPDAEDLLTKLPPAAAAFLAERGFVRQWDRFARQFSVAQARLRAFHGWFDGLATLQLIHHLTAECWAKRPLIEAWNGLLGLMGRSAPRIRAPGDLLAWVREEGLDYPGDETSGFGG
ncbi:MAG: hypothetical protein GXP31_05400 [Kiritimatiellaeota bacterium]|nr:hypothetical protein [Kiritimatiellota bacterium]